MTDRTESPRRPPDAVGEDVAAPNREGKATGTWIRFGALTWSVVIGLALVFVVAILVAAR